MNLIHSTAGVILSAGASKRMGEPKALLRFEDGTTLLSRQANLLGDVGCERIVVVVGADAGKIEDAHPELDVEWVMNEGWETGQFSSLQRGLGAIEDKAVEGAIVLPVDVVGVAKTTVATLIETALFNTHLKAIVPEYNEHGGHPIYLAHEFFRRLLDIDTRNEDARLDVQLRLADDVMRLPVNDPHIVRNINTPDEWAIYK